ncbi:hypothetical protein GCM10018789_12320 [Streptomyces werraensis]|nr:hypothetical protein GCM10018789_12320 [Streptomyces werraensis]
MVRIARTVALAPVPRPWLVDALGALTDLAESTVAKDGRVPLPDGRQVPELRPAEGRRRASAGAVGRTLPARRVRSAAGPRRPSPAAGRPRCRG